MGKYTQLLLTCAVLATALPPMPLAASPSCADRIDASTTGLGQTSAQLFEALGPPAATYDKSGPSNWLLYNLAYVRSVAYGNPARNDSGYSVFEKRYYFLDETHRIVGFALALSDRPSRLATVKQRLPWAASAEWDRIHLIVSNPVPGLLAAMKCESLVVMLHADCHVVAVVDPKTYETTGRDPWNLGECRFRGLFVQRADRTTDNAHVPYRPFEFTTK